jgi:hypothetical protein
MLEACCSCGRVRRLITPENPLLVGSVAVTFEEVLGAQECFVKLNRRRFDSRELSVRLFFVPPRPHPSLLHTQLPQQHTHLPLHGNFHHPPHEVQMLLPSSVASSTVQAVHSMNNTSKVEEDNIAVSNFLSSMQEAYGDAADESTEQAENRNSAERYPDDLHVEEAARDTEDFLNSLL